MKIAVTDVSGYKAIVVKNYSGYKAIVCSSDVWGLLTHVEGYYYKYGNYGTASTNGTLLSYQTRSGVVRGLAETAFDAFNWATTTDSAATPQAYIIADHIHGTAPPRTSPWWRFGKRSISRTYSGLSSLGVSHCDSIRLRLAKTGMFSCSWDWVYVVDGYVLRAPYSIVEGQDRDDDVRLWAHFTVAGTTVSYSWTAAQITAMNVTAGNTASTDTLYRRSYSGWITSEKLESLRVLINSQTDAPITIQLEWAGTFYDNALCYPCHVAGVINPSMTTKCYSAQQPELLVGGSN